MFAKIFYYGAGNILVGCIPFIFLPFFVQFLSPEVIGLAAFVETLIAVACPAVIFGMDAYYTAEYVKNDHNGKKQLLATCIAIPMAISFLIFLTLAIIPKKYISYSNLSPEWMLILPVLLLGIAVNTIICARFQMQGKAVLYSAYRVANSFFAAATAVVAVIYIGPTIDSRLFGIYAGPILISIMVLVRMFCKKDLTFSDNLKIGYIKPLKYGVGAFVHSWGAIVFFSADRLIVGYICGAEDLGFYSVSSQVGMLMTMVQTTFSQIWTPYSFNLLLKGEHAKFSRIAKLSILLLFLLSLSIIAAAPLLYKFFVDPKYLPYINITFTIVVTYFLLGVYKIYVVKFFLYEKTQILAIVTTSCAILNILLTYMAVSFKGVTYGALGTLISVFVYASFILFFGEKYCGDSSAVGKGAAC